MFFLAYLSEQKASLWLGFAAALSLFRAAAPVCQHTFHSQDRTQTPMGLLGLIMACRPDVELRCPLSH